MTVSVAQAASREAPPFGQVVLGPFTFVSHCTGDGTPFFGSAVVGYVPTDRRLVPATLRRMVKQAARHGEAALPAQLAAMLELSIHPAGVALVVQSGHDCAGPRLLDEDGWRRATSWRGRYRADRSLRSEFLALYAQTAP